ncbi:hypothetical protein DYB28_006602 [Aphanomyces astaci]|uniref:DDE-1 domain-containing protein n=1 Tax=Aphanomyces astaci TaxID=112090 RepID=A0A9X8HB37_APHAT|nr:hypothetical protein DYB28_006602 [Aphanomyces astaci]
MCQRTQYPISIKLEAIGLLEPMSCREVARVLKVPRRTVRSWLAQRFELLAYDGNKKNNKLEPGDRYEEFPDPPGLPDAAYNSLLKLLQRFCKRHCFSRQRPAKNKLKQTVLAEVAAEFAGDFHHEYASYSKDSVFDVDETGMYYDLPPSYIWAVRGGSSKISAVPRLCGIVQGHVRGIGYAPLPPNSTSVCQPLDVGVMAPFKRNLRNLWILEEQIIGDEEDPYSLTAQQKLMAMVQRAISVWDMVSEDVLRRSFEKAIPTPEHNANH